jgi:hypothetical protein
VRRRLALLIPFLFAAVDAFARAGGGGGYSGGGGFGGGGSFGGGYGGYSHHSSGIVDLYLAMVIAHPVVGVPTTLILFWLYVSFNRANQQENADVARAADEQVQTRRKEALAVIRRRDPDYDEGAFLARTAKAFLAIQEAWGAQDMSKARAFISDGVFERFQRQIAEQKSRGFRNSMTQVQVQETEALGYLAGLQYDSVAVRVKASALDQNVALDGGAVLSGGRSVFEEVWTFLRRPGVKTLKHPGLMEGQCPSCGAPLQIADAAQCAACKAWVNSGEFDWVLVEITQMSEWAFPDASREVTGWQALSEADPGLSLEALEDRASMVFWRWLDARRRMDPKPLLGVADDAFLQKADLKTSWARDAAVGGVETIAFEPGMDFDRVHIRVRWEAERMERGAGGETSRGRDRRTHFLVFRRRSGVVSDVKAGLRAARCPSCGAPPSEPDAASCAYCGHKFNDGSISWVLWDIVPYGQWRRPSEGPSAPVAVTGLDWGQDLPPAEAVAVLTAGLAADGSVDDRERAFLTAYARRRGLDSGRVDQYISAAMERRLEVPAPKSGAEAEEMLRGLIRMCLADGVVSDQERALLAAFGRRLGLHDQELRTMIKEERLALQARAAQAVAERMGS